MKKPEPCTCERLPFPHRAERKCQDFAEAQRELDDDEPYIDGTSVDVINWMRAEVGRG